MINEYIQYHDNELRTDTFEMDQYEEYYNSRNGFDSGLEARYIKQVEADYMGNPLIEALPPIYSMEEVVNRIERDPTFDDKERFYEDSARIHAVLRLEGYLHVFLSHLQIESQLGLIIRRGYTSKILSSNTFKYNLLQTSRLVKKQDKGDILEELKCTSYGTTTPTTGFLIYGPSGMGKTTCIKNILKKCYPQYIIHTNYKGKKMLFHQLVWLKIDCSHNGGIKGICKKFFRGVDAIIGTNHNGTFGNKGTVDDMIAAMAHVAQLHGLGVLIIDELQHIADSKTSKREVLNFLVTLQNEIKLPIIFIGTYKLVKDVLTLDYRQARRASGIGEVELGFLNEKNQVKKDEEDKEIDEWLGFITELWKYQWTHKKADLTDEIKKVLYEESVGIIDRVLKLFMISQINAILEGSEEITVAMIRKVSKQQMKLSKKMIDAVRDRDIDTLAKLGDLNSLEMKEYIEHSLAQIQRKKYNEEMIQLKNSESYRITKSKKEKIDVIASFLMQADIDEKNSYSIAEEVLKELGNKADIANLNKKAIRKALELEKSKAIPTTKKKGQAGVKKARNGTKENFYDEYKERDKVKSPEDDFSDD